MRMRPSLKSRDSTRFRRRYNLLQSLHNSQSLPSPLTSISIGSLCPLVTWRTVQLSIIVNLSSVRYVIIWIPMLHNA